MIKIFSFGRAPAFAWILLFGLLALTARPATDPDLWWHLRTGQWMVENRQVPHTDPFSFTRNGATWVAHEWLSELILFGVWRVAGWTGLIIFSCIVTTTGFMLLFRRCAAPPHWAAAATVLGALASAPTWGVRPQMFTFVLASLWLLLLERSEDRPWLLACLPPLFLLWLNLHAGFALGPAMLIAYIAGMMWELLAGESEWRVLRRRTLQVLFATGVCFALVPLNPSGRELYRYPLHVLHSSAMRSFISEWQSPDFHQGMYFPLLLLSLALLTAFALLPVRPRPRTLLPLLGTFLAALDAVRHITIFVLFAVPVIAAAFHQPSARLRARSEPAGIKIVLTGAVVAMMALFAAAQWIKVARDQADSEADTYPTEAIHCLVSLSDRDRVFVHYDWGGYLIWKAYPKSRVFVDGRADLYDPDLLRQFRAVMQLKPDWRHILESWDVNAVLVPSSSAPAQGLALEPHWHLQYKDSDASLFVRQENTGRTPPIQAVSQGSPMLVPPSLP